MTAQQFVPELVMHLMVPSTRISALLQLSLEFWSVRFPQESYTLCFYGKKREKFRKKQKIFKSEATKPKGFVENKGMEARV